MDFKCITYLKATAEEAEMLTGFSDLLESAKHLCSLGAKEVFITKENSIFVYTKDESFTIPINKKKTDSFIGTYETAFAVYIARRIKRKSVLESALWAAGAASIKNHNDPIKCTRKDISNYVQHNYLEYLDKNKKSL